MNSFINYLTINIPYFKESEKFKIQNSKFKIFNSKFVLTFKNNRMTLIKSISGIRGTIGGKVNDNLTPIDIVKFASAYGYFLLNEAAKNPANCPSCVSTDPLTVIIGRDARISGKMVSSLVANTLVGLGINVIDLGLSTTPTVEIAVPLENADGGIILTASHNPKQWNALKKRLYAKACRRSSKVKIS